MASISRRQFQSSLAALGVAWQSLARADSTFPTKPLKIVCPFAPGGGSDFIARVAANVLNERLGQPVYVENRPGAGGTLGTEYALRSPADGYTLLLIAGSYTVNPALYKLRFDPVADMTPVIQLSKGAYVVCVNPKLPVKSLQELFSYAHQQPGRLTFASAGNGSHLHIATEYMLGMAKVKATHIPYKGTGPAITDLLAGNVDMFVAGTEGLMPHVKSRKLRALAVTTAQRLTVYPDIPSVAESGLPDYDVAAWHGLIASKNLPASILSTLNRALDSGLQSKELIAQLEPTGVSPAGGSPQQFGQLIKTEIPRYSKVAQDNAISGQ